MDKKVSVVIPVYNVEPEFIDKAVNSVLNQTYKNIEILVINDGSTNDDTLKYLSSIDNPVIKIINQENKGLGGARNTGIINSTGEYISFLDADDWLDNNYYEVLLNLCESNDADIACATLLLTGKDEHTFMDCFENNVATDFLEKMKYITNGSTCSKIFKKQLFSNIKFEEKRYYEDNPVLIEMLSKSNKVAFTNKVKYYYRKNPQSICLNPKISEKRKNDKLHMLNCICNIIKDKTEQEKDAVLHVFTPLLVEKSAYNSEPDYKSEIKNILGANYQAYLHFSKNTFLENIFSLKNSDNKAHKIITILGVKIKIKRKLSC